MSTRVRPTRSWAFVVALLVAVVGLSPLATAGEPIEPSLSDLSDAILTRVTQLAALPTPTKRKALGRAYGPL